MTKQPIQDFYPDDIAICFGCGRHNSAGLSVKTIWNGEEGICHFTPAPHHTAYPGIVYGGLIACLIDCHSIGTAVAAAYDAEGRKPGTEPLILFFTAKLTINYLLPTPTETELVLRAHVSNASNKKVIVFCSLFADGIERARGEVVAVRK